MNNIVITAILALALSAGAAVAQDFQRPQTDSSQIGSTGNSTLFEQAPRGQEHASGRGAYSAFARNVGPGSSVTGQAESDLGSAGAGNDENPRAPAASGTGMGGN